MPPRFKMTPFDPPRVCILCGVMIPVDLSPGIANNHNLKLVRKEYQWEKIHQTANYIMVPSSEVESAYFVNYPRLGSCFIRVVIKLPGSTTYYLTGIHTPPYAGDSFSYAPNDVNQAWICGRKPKFRHGENFTRYRVADIGAQPRHLKNEKIGFTFHAGCWAVLGHVLGKELVEKYPAKVVHAAKRYWRSHEDSHEDLWDISDYRILSRTRSYRNLKPKYGCDIHSNPLVVPEIQELINRARRVKKPSANIRMGRLPLELGVMIMVIVCPLDYSPDHVQSAENLLSVFQWEMPRSFWDKRLQRFQHEDNLLFELKTVEDDASVDWQIIWLGLMRLLSDSTWYAFSGLGNRDRVLRSINAMKFCFPKPRVQSPPRCV